MKKIKILALFLITVLLYQNISFCVPNTSATLRPPLVINQTDFAVSDELKVDMSKDLEQQLRRINGFLEDCVIELNLDVLAVIPALKYKEEIAGEYKELGVTIPQIENNIVAGRWDLFLYSLNELYKNLRDHSKSGSSELYIQIGSYKKYGQAIRIVSRNQESIEGLMDILNGAKVRRSEKREELGYKGVGLIFLKEFALENEGTILIIDTNGERICVSKDDIASSRGIYPGTEVQVIISIPSEAGGLYSTDIKFVHLRNAL